MIKTKEVLKKAKCQAYLLLNTSSSKKDPNFLYTSGIDIEYGGILATKKRVCGYIPMFEYERLKKESIITLKPLRKKKRLFEVIKKELRTQKVKVIGINKNNISVNEYTALKKQIPGIKFVDISKELSNSRTIKTEQEIKIIKKTCKKTDKILIECIKKFSTFKTEWDAHLFLKNRTEELGAELAFPPIIASGKNASEPHHVPTKEPIKKGFCIIDYGIKEKGYCSDITRTIYLGKSSKEERELYNFMKRTQEELIKSAKKDYCTGALYQKSLKILGPYKKYFTHALGHGIGVEIHEMPNLSPKSKELIKEGMIFTIEPGIYTRKKGIRIEDDILITKKGPITLTKTSKELIEVK